jgi:tetratricopeptide (TPR) repeat protein
MIMSASHPPAACLMRVTSLLLALLATRGIAATAPVESANADIIAAETDLQHGECSSATRRYVEASAQMSDAKLAAHATEVALDCGQYQQALQVTERWRALSPQADEPFFAAVRAELGRYRIEAARTQFRLWLGAKPSRSDEDTVSAVANLAQQAGAAPTLDMIRDQSIGKLGSAAGQEALAELAFEGWDFERALRYAQAAQSAGADAGAVAALEARAHAGLGQADEALAAAHRAIASGPKQHLALAEALLLLGRDAEAEKELLARRTDAQVGATARRRLALLAYTQGNFALAKQRMRELLKEPESIALAVYYLSAIAARDGEYGAAVRGYSSLGGTDFEVLARQRLAELLYHNGDRDSALQVLVVPAGASIVQQLEAELSIAELLAHEGAPSEAATRIEAALHHFPGHPELTYQRAVLQEQAGHSEVALAQLEALHKDRPEDSGVTNALGYTLADHKHDLTRAEQLIRAALQSAPDNPAVLDSLGWVLYRQGQLQRALPLLERAFRLFHDGDIGAHWGEVLWAAGKHHEARGVWARALAADPDNALTLASVRNHAPDLVPPVEGRPASQNGTAI